MTSKELLKLSEAKKVFDSLDVRENTRRDYKARIGLFLKFIKENGFNRDTFLHFKRYLSERNDWTVSTKNKYLVSARIFLKELNRIGKLPADITQNIKSFQDSTIHKRDGLNNDEIEKIVTHINNFEDTPKTARIKALLSLFIFQGLRQIEIARLDVKDIDFRRGTANIQGKGWDSKEPVYLQPSTIIALREYLTLNNIKDGALFFNQASNANGGRITTRGIQKIVNKILKELDIRKTVHGFRHYFTTKLIKDGYSLSEVKSFTRHRDISTIEIYNDDVAIEKLLPKFYRTFKALKFDHNKGSED